MEKKFTWVFKKYSSWQDEKCYSRAFAVAGCNWHILARREGDKNDGHLFLYLELVDPKSLPQGWKRDVKFSLTLVTKAWGKSCISLETQCCFDAKNAGWGFKNAVSLTKLQAKGEGFLVNDKFIVVAQVHVLPAETVKIIEPDGASVQAENASKEKLDEHEDDDDDTSSKEASDDGHETSDEGAVDDGADTSLSNQSNALVQDNVAAETEVSNADNEDAPKEDVDDDEASSSLLTEIQPAKETIHVNGFEVYSSQVESVRHIFKRHPDIALGFRPKNQQIRRAYMNELLSLIETLCQSPEKLSEDDLRNAEDTLTDLIDVGFNLDWLKTRLNEVSEKKKKEQGSVARIQTMEEQLQKLKLMFLDLETQLQKEKAVALAARAPLSFDDVVC
ncbi:unnamed protein product [Microthlaspi erraticum]|uniref:MATH domain-containing protein n=1 Tax=Microthlaspi erraticum TaxID=1685480 RepID=A0A6D2KIT0_9BRAS|nr:unnamed protein product [Microthlaspi erraticum]